MALWPFRHEVIVIWGDLDAAGHVNNARYFTYIETARTKLHLAIVGKTDWRELDIILARTSCDFRTQASFGETLAIEVWPTRVGATSYTLAYGIREAATGRLVAEAESVQVAFDYKKNEKKPLPEAVRRALEQGLRQGSSPGGS